MGGSGADWDRFADEQGNEFAPDRLGMEPVRAASAERAAPNGSSRPRQGTVVQIHQGEAVNVLTCDTGNCQGEFLSTFEADIRVPAGTLAGTYRTTIVVEITAGPAQN